MALKTFHCNRVPTTLDRLLTCTLSLSLSLSLSLALSLGSARTRAGGIWCFRFQLDFGRGAFAQLDEVDSLHFFTHDEQGRKTFVAFHFSQFNLHDCILRLLISIVFVHFLLDIPSRGSRATSRVCRTRIARHNTAKADGVVSWRRVVLNSDAGRIRGRSLPLKTAAMAFSASNFGITHWGRRPRYLTTILKTDGIP